MPLPPGPKSPALWQTWAWIRRPTALLADCKARHGPVFTLRFADGRAFVVVSEPEHVEAVFRAPEPPLSSGRANANFRLFMGEHTLFALEGEAHRRHRRLLMPPFHGARMRAYGPLLVELVAAHAARWPVGRPFRFLEAARALTLDVIFRGVFGIVDPAQAAALERGLAAMTSLATGALVFLPALRRDLGPWSPWRRFQRARAAVDAILEPAIAAARAAPPGREDILALLVREGAGSDGLTDAEVKDELLTLLGAGHETTATGLAWALHFLLADRDALARAQAEADAAGDDDLAAVAALDAAGGRLPWLDAVVQESLRLAPPVPIAPRQVTAPWALAGWELPPGTVVTPSPWLAHRRAEAFEEPEAFRPARFLAVSPGAGAGEGEGARRKPTPFEYFPFGGGARLCIGRAFALFEMKAILALLLRRASFRNAGTAPAPPARESIVLVPRGGAPVVMTPREAGTRGRAGGVVGVPAGGAAPAGAGAGEAAA